MFTFEGAASKDSGGDDDADDGCAAVLENALHPAPFTSPLP